MYKNQEVSDLDNEKEIDIDLGKIFFMMKKRVIYIILATMVCAIVSGCVTEFFITPKYSTSCSMIVYNNAENVSTNRTANSNDLAASQQLVKTYIFVLTSDAVLEEVIKTLDLNMSTGALKSMISCSQHDETEIFRVGVTSTDPVLSANICNAIADVAPEQIAKKIKAGGVEIIDHAKVPSSPSSPNLKRNVLIGAALGFLVSFIGFFGYELFDTTITSEKDIEREFDVPLLGSIPKLVPAAEKESDSKNDTDRPAMPKRLTKKGDK